MDSSDWQPKLSTHRERCKYAFDNSLFCDVEFSVADGDGNKVTVPANKYPLAVCSPVFEAMFYGKLAESKFPINIQDCTKEGLQEILRFAHSEEANLTGSNVMEVLYLAKKYMMPFLEDKCKKYIQKEVEPIDVLHMMSFIQKMGDKDLEEHFWEIVDKKTDQVVLSESFLDVSREFLCQVLKRDTLDVEELHLFKAVDKWVTKRIEEKGLVCNGETKRTILGEDVIRLIRFPLMTQKNFVESVLPCKVLNMDEVIELFHIFSCIPLTTGMFLTKKRSRLSDNLLISDVRFHIFPSRRQKTWRYKNQRKDFLDFTVNKAVDLVGARLFGSEGAEYNVDLKIHKANQHECISTISSSYVTESEMKDCLYYGFTVTLDEPIRLEPGVLYTVEALIDGKPSYRGESGRSVVSAGDITITYKSNPNSINGTSLETGQFPSLVLQRI